MPRKRFALDRLGDVCGKALGERDRVRERLFCEHVLERRPDGREREGVSGQRAADAAGVLVVGVRPLGDPLREFGRDAERRRGHPAADRLADGDDVRFEAPGAGAAAGACAQRVRFVDCEQRPGRTGQLAERVVEAVVGEDDADVRQRGLGEDARDVACAERLLERVEVVELHDLRRQRRVHGRADVPGARADDAELSRRQRLVDGAVVAPVEDQHLPATRHLAGQPQREAVRVRGAQRELPEGEPEAPRELLADPGRILGREHRRRAASSLGRHRLDDGLRRVAGHRARVAEAEVDVLVAVDVDDPRSSRLLDEHGEVPGPARHPAHRDAEQERGAGALAQLERARMAPAKRLGLVLEPRGQAIAVDRDHLPPRSLDGHQSIFAITCLICV